MKSLTCVLFVLLAGWATAQKDSVKAPYSDPATGHELELLGGYSFISPGYDRSIGEWTSIVYNKHNFDYGVGYTYRWKRLRHQFYLKSFSTSYSFERSKDISNGTIDHVGEVTQQWLEVGGFGGFKIFDSVDVRLYPCFGFSFGIPVAGTNSGTRYDKDQNGTVITAYDMSTAPSIMFNIKLGLIYNFKLTPNFGVNTYLFYNRSLAHPDLLGDDNTSLGKLQINQVLFNLGIYYFIKSKGSE